MIEVNLYAGGTETFLPNRIERAVQKCTEILVTNPGLVGVVVRQGSIPREVMVDLLCETTRETDSLGWSVGVAEEMALLIGGAVYVNAPLVADQVSPDVARWVYEGQQVAYVTRDEAIARFWGLPRGSNGWKVTVE